jgi:hypothetical protein
MTPADPELGRFHRSFQRWARSVRMRLALNKVLSGLAIGLVLAAAVAAALWWQRLGAFRPWAAGLGILGAVVALVWAIRRRWSDSDIALYLDARLGTHEAISTAVELREHAERPDAAREVVVRDAARALDGDRKKARPRVLEILHGLGPLGAAAVTYLCLIPLPPAPPAPPPPPGSDMVQIANLKGLEKIERLESLDAKDAEQRERLKRIAEDARKLREQLNKGMEKREAQARIAKLRDDVAAERLKFGDEKNRAGLDAAVGKLGDSKLTKDAAKALGEGDLVEFDKKMAELANRAEKSDREEAKKALEEAAKAARQKGSEEIAKALEKQKKEFEEREGKAEALRELAKGMKGKLSEEALKDLEEFGETGNPEAQKRLAKALEEALEGMTDAEREALKKRMEQELERQEKNGGANPMTKKQLEDLSKKLNTPEGRKELAERLKELAREQQGKDAAREKGLEEGEQGGAEAERELGGMAPVPMESPGGKGDKGDKGDNKGDGNSAKNGQDGEPGGSGSKKDKGKGDHKGSTAKLDAQELRSKANAKLNPGMPMQGSSMGRAPSRPGETANRAGTGALGEAAPSELGGVEGAEVPEEYREQVGRYFTP